MLSKMVSRGSFLLTFLVIIKNYKYLSIQCLANGYNSDKISLKQMLKEFTYSMEHLWKHSGGDLLRKTNKVVSTSTFGVMVI